jgi:hypothetical protein
MSEGAQAEAADQDVEPAFHRRGEGSASAGPIGIQPSVAYQTNFTTIYRLRKRRDEQREEIFSLSQDFARLAGNRTSTPPPEAGLLEASAPTVEAQRAEIASLLQTVQANDSLIKSLREAIDRKRHEHHG